MCTKVWLIGASLMAEEYVKVLTALSVPFVVIGRGESSAEKFKKNTGVDVFVGGVEKFLLKKPEVASHAIISSGIEQLGLLTTSLLNYGVKHLLVEKPGGLSLQDVTANDNLAKKQNARVYIAYNRRFYSSVNKAKEIIDKDGGLVSFHFEFTEWSHVIETIPKLPIIKSEWFIANSSHVIDTAFYIGGIPQEWSAYSGGELSWHKPSVFVGAGKTDQLTYFTYCANWEAPGRWGIELMTRNHRLYLRPMEMLQIQKNGSVVVEPVDIDDRLDNEFKPGLYLQTKSFIEGNKEDNLCTISQQKEHWDIYDRMKGLC